MGRVDAVDTDYGQHRPSAASEIAAASGVAASAAEERNPSPQVPTPSSVSRYPLSTLFLPLAAARHDDPLAVEQLRVNPFP